MDNELKNLRLSNVEPAPGSNTRLKLYSVPDILREPLGRTTAPELVDVDKMPTAW